MTFTVKWSTPARIHFMHILKYIDNKFGEKTANEFIIQIDSVLEIISNMPEAFPVVKERNKVRRCLATKKTVLFYQIKGKTIYLINLYDTRMNPENFML